MKQLPDTQFEELKGMFSSLSEKIVSLDGSVENLAKATNDEFQRMRERFDRIDDKFNRLESYTHEGFRKVTSDVKFLHSQMVENFVEVRHDIADIRENYATKKEVMFLYTSLVPVAVSSTS